MATSGWFTDSLGTKNWCRRTTGQADGSLALRGYGPRPWWALPGMQGRRSWGRHFYIVF